MTASIEERIQLVNKAYFCIRRSGQKIVWLVDGLDEVLSNRNPCLQKVLSALHAAASSRRRPELFHINDLVVVTSAEASPKVPHAQFIAAINSWTVDEAVGYVRRFFKQLTVQETIFEESGGKVFVESCLARALEAVRKQLFGSFSQLMSRITCTRICCSVVLFAFGPVRRLQQSRRRL